MSEEVSHVTSDKNGWMEVSKGNAKSYKKQWCQLERGFLRYYTKPNETKCKGEMEIFKCENIAFAEESKKQPAFKVVSQEGGKPQTWFFVGESVNDLQEWMYILDRVRRGLSPDVPEGEVVKPKEAIKRPVRPTRRTKPT